MRHLFAIVLVLAMMILALCLFGPATRGSWRNITTSFKGFTNRNAVISIRNNGPVAVKLRDDYGIEYLGVPPHVPVAGLPNRVNYRPTLTNLVIAPSGVADFFIPMPEEGTSWVARLEFSRAGVWTRLGEKLIRRQDKLSTSLPYTVADVPVRAVPIYEVTQKFEWRN